jgi:hypothetical protein
VALFELELLGEGVESRYRKMRPEVESMPWGTLDVRGIPEPVLVVARKAWTGAAFQEHRTGIACAASLRALMECRAPIDLVGMATRFPMDEMVHVELCARMAMELGGATEIEYDPAAVIDDAEADRSPLVRAADLIVRFFCVGEALSIPLLRGTWRAARHPLPRAVLGRIVKDEAAHGTFGFTFLDWALPQLGAEDLRYLGHRADAVVEGIHRQWDVVRKGGSRGDGDVPGDALAWMQSDAYLKLAARSLEDKVRRPLARRGIALSA